MGRCKQILKQSLENGEFKRAVKLQKKAKKAQKAPKDKSAKKSKGSKK